ncbi:MAG: proteasome accessory factor PafA2 family protein [Propionicimonas sp.]|uniref:proteasome accessory factor PafA2 family protein n=1 Tax=Propionicimonas sp. TaxID=1955623 RepID=UPI003D140129
MTLRILGIETEYGIHAPGAPDVHPSVLSAAVVAGYPGTATGTTLDWVEDIPIEDAHNRVLANGARLYVDHAHPEYSGPEVTTARDAAAYDAAGDAVVVEAARAASRQLGVEIGIYKNNTDSHGASYGCHENHLVPRAVPWATIAGALPAFLVSRTVLVGAGRVGIGPHGERPGFQLSQRADFFETVEGIQTTRRRPLVNTRDEPHAPADRWRRLHVITGDANRTPYTTWLKAGTLAAFLTALGHGALPALALERPVEAFGEVSHDLGLRRPLPLVDGRRLTALDLQEALWEAVATDAARHPGAYEADVVAAWGEVIDDLRSDPSRCADRLDWVAKHRLLDAYAARDGLHWGSPRLAQLDLAWARLDRTGPWDALAVAGRFREVVSEADVRRALAEPPSDTRAWTRGRVVAAATERVSGAAWEWMLVEDAHGVRRRLDLSEPAAHTRAEVGDLGDAAAVEVLLLRASAAPRHQ